MVPGEVSPYRYPRVRPLPTSRALPLALLAALATSPAAAQLRIASWNVSNYNGTGREAAFRTAIYGAYQGRSMAPDAILCQEFTSAAAVTAFRNILNTAAGSPGDWQAAPFIDGNDTDNAFFYRSSRVTYLGTTIVLVGGNDPLPPRDVLRYDIRPVGYAAAATTIACYSSHMKAGNTTEDQQRRLAEATAVRNDANALPIGWNFLIGGDFNLPTSAQAAYQQLIGSFANNRGRFFDPINSPGNWANTQSFQFIHTQAPGSAGAGMDDRYDFILLSDSLTNQIDFDYIGNRSLPYSTTTWNDPNHSYRAWGNDGTTFNLPIATATNTMVGAVVGQAIRDTAGTDSSGGHLPVFLDLRVPAKVGAPATLDFGNLPQGGPGSTATLNLFVGNDGDVTLWSAAGVANLSYTLAGTPGVSVPAGSFTAAAGLGNTHTVTVSTAVIGPISGTITITSSSSEHPIRTVTVTGAVVGSSCYANCDQSTTPPVLNVGDFTCFLQRFAAGESYANCDLSTTEPVLNVADFTCFLQQFAAGCP
jgi:hypothetical protein